MLIIRGGQGDGLNKPCFDVLKFCFDGLVLMSCVENFVCFENFYVYPRTKVFHILEAQLHVRVLR